MSIENQETITFNEFRAWLTGLIRGKNGVLPNLEDWKMIKRMIDKVEPDRQIVPVPTQPYPPEQPFRPRNERPWMVPQGPTVRPDTTAVPPYSPPVVWCSSDYCEPTPDEDLQLVNSVGFTPEQLDNAFKEFFEMQETHETKT